MAFCNKAKILHDFDYLYNIFDQVKKQNHVPLYVFRATSHRPINHWFTHVTIKKVDTADLFVQ